MNTETLAFYASKRSTMTTNERAEQQKEIMKKINTVEGLIKQAKDHEERLRMLLRDLCQDWEKLNY